MDIQVIKGEILEQQADLLVLGVHEFSEEQGPVFKRLSNDLQEKLQIHLESNEFEGKSGQQVLLPAPDAIHAAYVLIVGLGNKKDGLASTVRQIAGSVMKTAKSLGLSSVALELFGEDAKEYDAKTIARNLVESLLIADYDFSRYKEAEKKKVVIGPITICTTESKHVRLANGVLDDTRSIVDGVNIARDLVITPAGDMNPAHLAEAAHDIAKQSNNI